MRTIQNILMTLLSGSTVSDRCPLGGTFWPLFDSMCAEVGCSWLDDGGCSNFVALQTEVQKVANVKDEFVILMGKTVN